MNVTTTTETAYDLLCSCDASGALYASGPQVIGSYRSLNDARRGAASRLQSVPAVGPGCYSIRNTDFSEENEFQPVCEAPAELAFNAGRLDCRTGRMARFLSPAEIAQWVAGIEAIKADPALAVKYNLGSM